MFQMVWLLAETDSTITIVNSITGCISAVAAAVAVPYFGYKIAMMTKAQVQMTTAQVEAAVEVKTVKQDLQVATQAQQDANEAHEQYLKKIAVEATAARKLTDGFMTNKLAEAVEMTGRLFELTKGTKDGAKDQEAHRAAVQAYDSHVAVQQSLTDLGAK